MMKEAVLVILLLLISSVQGAVEKESTPEKSKEMAKIEKTRTDVGKETKTNSTEISKSINAEKAFQKPQPKVKKEVRINPEEKLTIGKDLITEGIKRNESKAFIKVGERDLKIETTEKGTLIKEYKKAKVAVKTNTTLIYDNGNLISEKSGKQIKYLPHDIEQNIKGVSSVELFDDDSPRYKVITKNQGRLFGFIPVSISKTYEISAETGNVINAISPWWNTFAWQITMEPGEGESCTISEEGNDCQEGLRCFGTGILSASDTPGSSGICYLDPPAFHGRLVFAWNSWDELEEYAEERSWDNIPGFDVREEAYETEEGVELSLDKWIDLVVQSNNYDDSEDDITAIKAYLVPRGSIDLSQENRIDDDLGPRGNFVMQDVQEGVYNIFTKTSVSWRDDPYIEIWSFTVNDEPETAELDLCGHSYNRYNKLILADASTPTSPTISPIGEETETGSCN